MSIWFWYDYHSTVKPRFTNTSDHEQFGLRTNFPDAKRLGWRTVSRVTNTEAVNIVERFAGSISVGSILGKNIDLEVNSEDVEELLEDHKDELSTEELE